ncbi:MAG: hypothetical protein ACI9FB_003750 [Candidatus Azotimanducaceae bacterium]|jgi:hypothetical protein
MGPRPKQIIEHARLLNLDLEEAFRDVQYLSGTARLQQLRSSVQRWMRVNSIEVINQIN